MSPVLYKRYHYRSKGQEWGPNVEAILRSLLSDLVSDLEPLLNSHLDIGNLEF